MKNNHLRSVASALIASSSLVAILGTYLVVINTNSRFQSLVAVCGQIIQSVSQYFHLSPNNFLSFSIVLTAIIGVGLALLRLVKFSLSYRRLKQRSTVKNSPQKLVSILQKHSLQPNSISVIKHSSLTAYTLGLLKPTIVISESLINHLSHTQLEAVILHELYHFRHRHLLWLFLSQLASKLFFFVPLIGHLAQQLKTEFELAADAFVIETQRTKKHLSSSLALNLQHANSSVPHFATSPIERRIESLLTGKTSRTKMGITKITISFASLALMISLSATQPLLTRTSYANGIDVSCQTESSCFGVNCDDYGSPTQQNFTPHLPISFQ